MNSIPCRADDLRHIGPHVVKPRAGKWTRITCARHGYASCRRLVPLSGYNIWSPVRIAHSHVVRINDLGDYLPRTRLYTPKAILADIVDCVRKLFDVEGPLVICIIYALTFDALKATQAPRLPIKDGAFPYGNESRRCRLCFNVVFLWHLIYVYRQSRWYEAGPKRQRSLLPTENSNIEIRAVFKARAANS
jgi:hypothetical protein